MKNRSRLYYSSRDGVLDTCLGNDINELLDFLKSALGQARPGCQFLFLDTFFSDSINNIVFADVLDRATRANQTILVYLANPRSFHALSRSREISQNASDELLRGLQMIAKCLRPDVGHDAKSVVHEIEQSNHVSVQLYDGSPSGPMFFFGDLVVCGRFAAGRNAVDMAWQLIIDHPDQQNDQYDLLRHELAHLSSDALPLPTFLDSPLPSFEHRLTATQRLAQVLFLDIVGFTAVSHATAQRDAFMALQTALDRSLRACGLTDESFVYISTGDGAAVVFLMETGVDLPLRVARSVRKSLATNGLQLRQGLSWGRVDCFEDRNGHRNVLGQAINIAARLMEHSEPDSILVTREYFDQALTDESLIEALTIEAKWEQTISAVRVSPE